jgi:hypothetical protein
MESTSESTAEGYNNIQLVLDCTSGANFMKPVPKNFFECAKVNPVQILFDQDDENNMLPPKIYREQSYTAYNSMEELSFDLGFMTASSPSLRIVIFSDNYKLAENQLAVSKIEIHPAEEFGSFELPLEAGEALADQEETIGEEEAPLEASIHTVDPVLNRMEEDASVREVLATLCQKVYSQFSKNKSEGDYLAQINSLSNLVDQHLKSKAVRNQLSDEETREKFFPFFLYQMVDNKLLTGELLEQVFAEGLVDSERIRQAGKVYWHLEKTSEFVSQLVEKGHKALR